jgi:hypothetical protein
MCRVAGAQVHAVADATGHAKRAWSHDIAPNWFQNWFQRIRAHRSWASKPRLLALEPKLDTPYEADQGPC